MDGVHFPLEGLVGAIPGVLALFAAAVSHGRSAQRLDAVEKELGKVNELRDQVVRMDERLKNVAQDATEIKDSVDRLVQNMLEDGRRYGPRRRAPIDS